MYKREIIANDKGLFEIRENILERRKLIVKNTLRRNGHNFPNFRATRAFPPVVEYACACVCVCLGPLTHMPSCSICARVRGEKDEGVGLRAGG